jgi:hypothetical protein
MKIWHLSRVAHKPDLLDAIRTGLITDGTLMKRLDAQMKIAQAKKHVSQGRRGVHCMSYCEGAACDAAFLVCSSAHVCCGERGSKMFDPFQGACGAALAEMCTDCFLPELRHAWRRQALLDWVL